MEQWFDKGRLTDIQYATLNSLPSIHKERVYTLRELIDTYDRNRPDQARQAELEKVFKELDHAFAQTKLAVADNIDATDFDQLRNAQNFLIDFANSREVSLKGQA